MTVALVRLMSCLVHTGLQIPDLQEVDHGDRKGELTAKGDG